VPASFVVEGLTFHVETGTFSCETSIKAGSDQPLDDVLTYYQGLGHALVK
jgi:hypothetical protein